MCLFRKGTATGIGKCGGLCLAGCGEVIHAGAGMDADGCSKDAE